MKAIVIDASVAVKWAVAEAHSKQALSLLIPGNLLLAPAHWLAEAATALWDKCAVNRAIARSDLDEAIDILVTAPVQAIPLNRLVPVAVPISLELRVPVYDSLYVALAVDRSLPFVTADRRLFEKLMASPKLRRVPRWIGSPDRKGPN